MSMSTDLGGTDLPAFLAGTFDWRMNGLHIKPPLPIDLRSPELPLTATNPWVALAAVLEVAKAGDHSQVHRLAQFVDIRQPYTLSQVALLLVGDMGTDTDLQLLERALATENPETRLHAAHAAVLAGRLWLVPGMVRRGTRHQHSTTATASATPSRNYSSRTLDRSRTKRRSTACRQHPRPMHTRC